MKTVGVPPSGNIVCTIVNCLLQISVSYFNFQLALLFRANGHLQLPPKVIYQSYVLLCFMHGLSLCCVEVLTGFLVLTLLGTNLINSPASSFFSSPVRGSMMGLVKREQLSSRFLIIARKLSIGFISPVMYDCKFTVCDSRAFMIGSSLVPRSW